MNLAAPAATTARLRPGPPHPPVGPYTGVLDAFAYPASVPTSTRPSTRSRVNTRQRLLEAAAVVFAEKGANGVTVDELTTAAGFSRGAFYSNFSSIEELFHAVVELQAHQLLDGARALMQHLDEDWSAESLGELLRGLMPEDRSWFLLQQEFTVQAMRSERTRAAYAEMHAGLRGEIDEIVGSALARLGRRPLIPISHLSETVVALFLHGMGNDHHGAGVLSADTAASEVPPHLLVGLSAPA